MNPLVPLFILFLIPLTAIGAVLRFDDGVSPELFYAAAKTSVILVVIGAALSFVVSRLAERSKG